MKTIALPEILDQLRAPGSIDYFSLDVEGAETLVMNDFPWGRYNFTILTVERPKEELKQTLGSHGYHMLRENSGFGDLTWVHETLGKTPADFQTLLATWKNGAKLPSTCMTELGYATPPALQP